MKQSWVTKARQLIIQGILILCLVVLGFRPVTAQTSNALSHQSPSQHVAPSDSLKKSLEAEAERKIRLQTQLQQIQQEIGQNLRIDLNAYKIQLSTESNLLSIPDISVEELEKVHGKLLVLLGQLTKHFRELTESKNSFEQERLQAEEQYTLNQQQLNEIINNSAEEGGVDSETALLAEKLRQLTTLIAGKQEFLREIESIYTERLVELGEIRQYIVTLSEKFDRRIEERRKEQLFEKTSTPLASSGVTRIPQELDQITEYMQLLISPLYWKNSFLLLWQTEGFLLLRSVLLLAIMLFLLFRVKRTLSRFRHTIPVEQFPWRCLMIQLLERSLLLSGVTLFFYIYEHFILDHSPFRLSSLLVSILLVLLLSRWMLDLLKNWKGKQHDDVSRAFFLYVRSLILLTRYAIIIHILATSILHDTSIMLAFGRIGFDVAFLLWNILFWKNIQQFGVSIFPVPVKIGKGLHTLLPIIGHLIAITGLFSELIGYGSFAQYWYVSWGQTFAVILWSVIIFMVLREWELDSFKHTNDEQEAPEKAAHQFHWFIVRIAWVVWPACSVIGLVVAWGEKQMVFSESWKILTYSVSIGGISLSLLGIVYGIGILLLTHIITRLWSYFLKQQILVNSGLEIGVQVSITTISVYVIWLIGILWALNAIGVGTASIAVTFGALGIGLGFGLQSIFNNFFSGLILLFERPVEVGDVLEVSGAWGVVEKINVRSTVIRTYDNSALIIPNSEIISNQLTNWTFKDVRMRRTIQVGVAYGSNVRLVEQMLYDIAEKHPRVMTDPAPMVLFSDFGDHALIFKLRVWTLLDYGLTTETEIRFEIDKIFREKQIEIAFPQLDLHIKHPEQFDRLQGTKEEGE